MKERRKNMKTIWVTVCTLFFWTSMALADEVGDRLSNQATEQIRNSARQMIELGIDTDDVIEMTQLMLEYHFRQELTLRAHEIIISAHKQGLPPGPIMSKAYEGMTKQIQDQNIVQAMETVRSRYAFAYRHAEMLAQDRAQMHLIGRTIAQGLTAGMNREDVGRITEMLQHRAQQMTRAKGEELAAETFMASITMARLGVSSKATTDVVGKALQNNYTARNMKALRNSFMTQSRNVNPTNLAKSYAQALNAGKGIESPGFSGSGGSGGGEGSGGSGAPGGPGGSGGAGGHGGSGGSSGVGGGGHR
jgi:hypothetical protein